MYSALWRALPGPRLVRALTLLMLAAAVISVLLTVVFPWAAQFVPGQEVSVN